VRILLDECIDESLRHGFAGHECHTCRYAGLKGLANGELLTAAEQAGYDVLITVDKNLPHQQNLSGRVISVIVLDGHSTNIDDLVSLMPDVLTAMDSLEPGQFLRIGAR
jgi:predicted nuclease of predicted toxin-antitoxin system